MDLVSILPFPFYYLYSPVWLTPHWIYLLFHIILYTNSPSKIPSGSSVEVGLSRRSELDKYIEDLYKTHRV